METGLVGVKVSRVEMEMMAITNFLLRLSSELHLLHTNTGDELIINTEKIFNYFQNNYLIRNTNSFFHEEQFQW